MLNDLASLESSRTTLLRQIAQLRDLRPGSVGGVFRRCGKPTCHCARPKDPGHGPHFQFTYKKDGKTFTETLSSPAAVDKAKQEVAEFRRFEQLSGSFVEVNQKICQSRPIQPEQGAWTAEEKKRLLQSIRRLRER